MPGWMRDAYDYDRVKNLDIAPPSTTVPPEVGSVEVMLVRGGRGDPLEPPPLVYNISLHEPAEVLQMEAPDFVHGWASAAVRAAARSTATTTHDEVRLRRLFIRGYVRIDGVEHAAWGGTFTGRIEDAGSFWIDGSDFEVRMIYETEPEDAYDAIQFTQIGDRLAREGQLVAASVAMEKAIAGFERFGEPLESPSSMSLPEPTPESAKFYYNWTGKTCIQLARMHHQAANFNLSIPLYIKGRSVSLESGDLANVAEANLGLAGGYAETSDYDLALDYYQDALSYYEEVGELVAEGIVAVQIGLLLVELGNDQDAVVYLERAISILEPGHPQYARALAALNELEI